MNHKALLTEILKDTEVRDLATIALFICWNMKKLPQKKTGRRD